MKPSSSVPFLFLSLFSTVVLFQPFARGLGDHEVKADPQAIEVIEKNLKAIGGRETLARVQTLIQHGTLSGDLSVRVSGWMTDFSSSPKASSLSRPMPKARKTGDMQIVQKTPRLFAETIQVGGELYYSGGTYSILDEGDVA